MCQDPKKITSDLTTFWKTRQTFNKLSEILQMSRQSVIESRLGFFLSILHVMSKNNSLEKRNDLSSSRHNMDQLSDSSIVSRSSFKKNLTQLSTSRSKHPTEVRTKDRQRRREKDSLTEQWHDNTEFQDTETLRHPCHADMLMYNCLLVSDFRYSFAPPTSVTTTLRSGFVNFGRAMMSSLVHPLRYPCSGQKIHSWTLRVLHPNICFYRRKKVRTTHTRSSVIDPELDLIHWITNDDRLSKVRLIIWRRSLTRDWLKRSVSAGKKRHLVIVISYTECDKETIIIRRHYAAMYFLDMSRLKVDLCSVIDERFPSSCKLKKKCELRSTRRRFLESDPLFYSCRDDDHVNEMYCCSDDTKAIIMHFPLFSPVSFFSWSIKRWLFRKWELTISIWTRKSSHWIETCGEKTMIRRKLVTYIYYAYELEDSHLVVVTRMCQKRTMSFGENGVILMDAFIHYADGYESFLIQLMYRCLVCYSAQLAYYDEKGSGCKRQIYISFTRYVHADRKRIPR